MVIRNIPDDVLRRFKERARAESKSAEQLAREVIAEKARPATEEAWARIDALRNRSKRIDGFNIADEIREARADRDTRITGPDGENG